jgi:hypothetical protein
MTATPTDVLGAAARPSRGAGPAPTAAPRKALVVGAGGALGAAVVESLLMRPDFACVGVLAAPSGLQAGLRRLRPLPDDVAEWAAFAPDTALVVFDRERHANGRDAGFVRPLPADLTRWAKRLRAAGASTLVVVVPHAPGRLPQALRLGLASLDEAAVAALGFRHLVFMRTAQAAPRTGSPGTRAAPERLAHWMLSQLHWMVPSAEQPVRTTTVARVAARLAAALPRGPAGTRVLTPEWLWVAAQRPGSDAPIDDWLVGAPLPPLRGRTRW